MGYLSYGKCPKQIAIVDDYIGTGKTIRKFIDKLQAANNRIVNSKIVILSLNTSCVGQAYLQEYALKNNIMVDIITLENSEAAFVPNKIFAFPECESIKNRYIEFCEQKEITEPLGHGKIEALVSFYYNTPNNTLGAFWCNINSFVGLFGRHEKKETTIATMRQKAKENKMIQKNRLPIRIGENYRYNLFLTYCVNERENFSFQKCSSVFGLTQKQLDEMLEYAHKSGHLLYDAEKKCFGFTTRYFRNKLDIFNVNNGVDLKITLKDTGYIPKSFDKKFHGYDN
jgi:hypothetical protein